MKEKWDELEALFKEDGEVTTREFCLIIIIAFLAGVVLGMFFSPKKHVTIGSNNASNNIIPCDDEQGKEEA